MAVACGSQLGCNLGARRVKCMATLRTGYAFKSTFVGHSRVQHIVKRLRQQHRYSNTCHASGDDIVEGGERQTKRILKTISGLDALLGIEPEETVATSNGAVAQAPAQESTMISISNTVLHQLAEAEAVKRAAQEGKTDEQLKSELLEQMTTILDKARKVAVNEAGEEDLRKGFEDFLKYIEPKDAVDKADLQKLKDAVFGPMSFWVTETRSTDELAIEGGVLIRGNLRAERATVFENVITKTKELFGDKYEVLMVEDPEAEEEEGPPSSYGPRVAFKMLPAHAARPKSSPQWVTVAAIILGVLTVGSVAELGFISNVAKLPKETLEWIAKPENAAAIDVLPPGLEGWDPTPYIRSAVPISASVLGVQAVHEIGHRVAAFIRKVRLGPSLFIPNFEIGTFGALTQIKSLLKTRRDLFDVAAAGPVAGGLASLALFITGLIYSTQPDTFGDLLVPMPSAIFQGSLLLGGVAKTVLTHGTVAKEVMVHPYLVGGWCGLVATALNCLPVGSVDGGRVMQAAFGRTALGVSSFFTYVGLALGFLGGSLALPFGLYVLILQREPESAIQDQVSPIGEKQQAIATALFIAAVLILLPMVPDAADTANLAAQSNFI